MSEPTGKTVDGLPGWAMCIPEEFWRRQCPWGDEQSVEDTVISVRMVRFVAHLTAISAPQHRWTLHDLQSRKSIVTGLEVEVVLDLQNGRTVTVTKEVVRVVPPTDAGTTGQTKTIKVPFDGGSISVLFSYWSTTADWSVKRSTVRWSLYKATSRRGEVDAVRRLVKDVGLAYESEPLAPKNGRLSDACDMNATDHAEDSEIDARIAETESMIVEMQQRLARMRDDRAKHVSDRAAQLARSIAVSAASAAVHARINALVDEAFPRA